jgi:MarR family transcriptional regulator, organic hydroperoxide resistance regulator
VSALDLDLYLDRLFTAFDTSTRHIQQDLANIKDFGLTGPQFYILKLLSDRNQCTVSELAEILQVKPSAITVMIDRLIKNEFVKRERNSQDRRIVVIYMTESGKKVFSHVRKKRKEVFKHYLSYLSEEDLNALVGIYEKLAIAIQENKQTGENKYGRTEEN